MNQPRIEVADLVVRYGDVTAVDSIGFDTPGGGDLLGPPAAETTTLRAVAGLTPSGGIIRLNGVGVFRQWRPAFRPARR
jgi:ABC-type multidrug transport system ATPase subunit